MIDFRYIEAFSLMQAFILFAVLIIFWGKSFSEVLPFFVCSEILGNALLVAGILVFVRPSLSDKETRSTQ